MTPGRSPRSRSAAIPDLPGPLRTCLGCRRVRPQAELVRLVRAPGGLVEPDPRRGRGGRGAYLCRSESCLKEAVRRGRWTQAFRAPATLTPEVTEVVRALLEVAGGRELGSRCDDGIHAVARGSGRSGVPVEGGW